MEMEREEIESTDITMTSSDEEEDGDDQPENKSSSLDDLSSSSTGDSDSAESLNGSSMISLDQSSIMNQSWTNFQEQIHQLQLHNRQKDDEITRLKRQLHSQSNENEERILNIRQQYDMQLMKERKSFKQWQMKTGTELRAFRGRMEILKSQRPQYLQNLKQIQTDLSGDFEITTDRYIELKQMDPSEVSLKQWIQTRVYDTVYPMRQRMERTSLELREIRNSHERFELENEELKQELKRKSKETTKLRINYSEMEKEIDEVNEQLSEKKEFYDKYRHKSSRIGEIETRSSELERKCFELDNELNLKTKELHSCVAEQSGIRKQNQIQRQTIELLKQDKMYLTNEVSLLNEQKTRLTDTNEHVISQNESLKEKRDELFQQLLDLKEGTKAEYERRMQSEIERLQNSMKLDLQKMTNTHTSLFQQEQGQLQSRLSTLQREHSQLTHEVTKLANKLSESEDEKKSIAIRSERIQAELKTKNQIQRYEIEKIVMENSRLEKTNKIIQLEREKAEKKVDILRKAVTDIKERYLSELSDLRSDVRIKTVELEGYKKFENELDSGIEAIGESVMMEEEKNKKKRRRKRRKKNVDDDDDEDEGEDDDVEERNGVPRTEELSKFIMTVPTSHKRRLQYCLTLVKKISLLEKANSVLQASLDESSRRIRNLSLEREGLERKLAQTSQPYSYLVGQLEKSETEHKKSRKAMIRLNSQNRKLKNRVKKLLGVNKVLGKDVERLLEQTVQIQKIKKYFEGVEREKFLGKDETKENGLIEFSKPEKPDTN